MKSLHHFACSGGTIISKCIAAMPNVILLSELDPLSPLSPLQKKFEVPEFSPSDPIRLLKHNLHDIDNAIIIEMFQESLAVLENYCLSLGITLVIRDHTHSHYCVGESVVKRLTLKNILTNKFNNKAIITVRDPIDSYLSLVKNNWLHFQPSNFDEYCKRLKNFLSDYEGDKIFKYEEFCLEPERFLKDVCHDMEIEFDENYHQYISAIKLTGDSGRSSDQISPRKRGVVPREFIQNAKSSSHYAFICNKLEYPLIDD
jgi:hypothetical protein